MSSPYFDNGVVQLYQADARALPLADESVHCVVTSPPYWGLRDYGLEPSVWGGDADHEHEWDDRSWYVNGGGSTGIAGGAFSEPGPDNAQRIKEGRWRSDAICTCGAWLGHLGLEPTPDLYVEHIVEIFREVHRVLRKDGTVWLNLGDSYSHAGNGPRDAERWPKQSRNAHGFRSTHAKKGSGLKPKDLVGMPWRVAFALQADGWWLRSDIVWSKPNPMPESVTDRPTTSHEYVFLLTKSERYYYDAAAIRGPATDSSIARWRQDIAGQQGSHRANGGAKTNGTMKAVGGPKKDKQQGHGRRHAGFNDRWDSMTKAEQAKLGANKRTVWYIATRPYPEAHFATFPEELVEPCVLAGSMEGGTVLDPFVGSGTTAAVAQRLGRRAVGVDLSADYLELAAKRLSAVPLPMNLTARQNT